MIGNLYLIDFFQLTYLDHNVRHSAFVDKDFFDETFVGIKFFNERKKSRKKDLRNRPYLRLAHGWATPSNLGRSSAVILKTINTATSSLQFSMDIHSPTNFLVFPLIFI